MTAPATSGPINVALLLRDHLPLAVRVAEAKAERLEKELRECRAEITQLRQVAIAGSISLEEQHAVAEPLVCEKCDEEITGTPVYVKGTEGVLHLNCSLRSE